MLPATTRTSRAIRKTAFNLEPGAKQFVFTIPEQKRLSEQLPRASNPHFFPGTAIFPDPENHRNVHMPQSRGFGRPRRSRLQLWNPGVASCRSSASVAQIIAAASIEVMDALFRFVVRNDAECSR